MKTKSTLLACISIALTCNAFAADLPPARNIPYSQLELYVARLSFGPASRLSMMHIIAKLRHSLRR